MWAVFKKPIREKSKDKIEFIKREEFYSGTLHIRYFTKKNGSYVSNSMSSDESEALIAFNKVKNGILLESEEVLETEFI